MAMQPDPTQLTTSTQLPALTHKRNFSYSRSPSRSPTRKAQFTAKELEPLLKDLSPESTLQALLLADIDGRIQKEHNDLLKSIAEASLPERKLSIRAAVASKKLKEWTEEVSAWTWPSRNDRAWGAGFISPESQAQSKFLGSLHEQEVQQREDRLDELFDALETLDMKDLKQIVHSWHPQSSLSSSTSYGSLRGITNVITGIVIQSLPVHANLESLLNTWSIRLDVLRQLPDLLISLNQAKSGLETINAILEDPTQRQKLNRKELEKGKAIFGNKISNLGRRVDGLLDKLADEEDTLPQAWLDSLEDIENKYALWVAKAEQAVLQNEVTRDPSRQREMTVDKPSPLESTDTTAVDHTSKKLHDRGPGAANVEPMMAQPANTTVKRKPLLEVNPKVNHGHKRGVSEISTANSTFSNYSENAEILDAHAAPVLPSPRISMIDHGSPSSTSKTSWLAPRPTEPLSPKRPSFVQRASAASIEVVPKEQIRQVLLRKSASHDMLSNLNISGDTQSTQGSVSGSLTDELSNPLLVPTVLTPLAVSPSPSLMVDPLSVQGGRMASKEPPVLPRRSSKRRSMPLLEQFVRPETTLRHEQPDPRQQPSALLSRPITPPTQRPKAETFDDKLKSILASMPAPFQLSDGSGSESSGLNSEASSRSSSPQRVLKLSPAKNHNANSRFEERVYNLQNNKHKDAQPIRLLVRAVGANGDRIMVRVGGGWADLAEYLREYSLHHGSKRLADGQLEVANYPAAQTQKSSMIGLPAPTNRTITVPDQTFDFGLTEDKEHKSNEEKELEANPWRPPPIPIVTESYNGPIARSTSPSRERAPPKTPPVASYRPASRTSTTTTTPTVTTTVTSSNHYTPLGGAGPVITKRRSAAQGSLRSAADEAWVDGLVSKARSVSGGQVSQQLASHQHASPSTNTTVSSTPVTTTTTTISSTKPRATASTLASRRVSSWSITTTPMATTPDNQRYSTISSGQGSYLSHTSSRSSDSNNNSGDRSSSSKRKSRISLGDVGGIRRVFLRKKSEK